MNDKKPKPYPKLLVELRLSRMLPGEIGLFAVGRLKRGAILAPARRYDERRLIGWAEFKSLDAATRRALKKFCPGSESGYHAPENLNFIHPLWYCNHSCAPNVAYDASGNLHAVRNISRDEELCFDYSTIDGNPAFRMKCSCGSVNCRGVVRYRRVSVAAARNPTP